MITPRIVVDGIFAKLQATDEATCQSQRAFYLLRKTFIKVFKLKRSAVTLDLKFGGLIPVRQQSQFWKTLKEDVSARSWPALVRPQWMLGSLVVFVCAVFVGSLLFLNTAMPGAEGLIGVIAATLAILTGKVSANMTRRFKVSIPRRYKTIRDLVPFAITSEQIKWTRGQVADGVKKIVLEILGIPESKYSEDAHFVKDLGVG
jgi:hypothetical protein